MRLKFRLDEIMKEHSVTGKQLAEDTGLRPQTISELRRDLRENIHKEHVIRLMNYFKEHRVEKWFEIVE